MKKTIRGNAYYSLLSSSRAERCGDQDGESGYVPRIMAEFLSSRASLAAQTVKNLPAMQETQVQSLGREDPLEKAWQPVPVFLPGEFHGQRSLAGL